MPAGPERRGPGRYSYIDECGEIPGAPAFFYAWLMDWERISVFDGRWYEWSRELATV